MRRASARLKLGSLMFPMLTNPMMQQDLNPNSPLAQQMQQMMIIMGGLGPKVPPTPRPQGTDPSIMAPQNPMATLFGVKNA